MQLSKQTRALILTLCLSGLAVWMIMSKPLGRLRVATAMPTVTVTSTADDGSVGTLRQVIGAAASGDTINFSVTGTITLTSGELLIDKNLTIAGPGATSLIISGNNASRVLHIASDVTVGISDLTISDGSGGGGIVNGGTLTVSNMLVSSNATALGNGAGIFNLAKLTITNSTVSGNSAGNSAGGIFNSGTLTITNSTVSGNSTTGDGGGIFNDSNGTTTIANCTVSGNSATGDGSGGGISNIGTVNIKNSIVANSTGGDCAGAGTFNASGVNFSTDSSCPGFTQVPSTGSGGLNLGPLQVNAPGTTATHSLLAGSVAIDAVTDCTDVAMNPVTTDQRGIARPIDGNGDGTIRCDAGAYEAPECALTCPANQTANTGPGATDCCKVVSYPAPTSDPICGEVDCSPPPGSCYPLGTTTVTCGTVRDGPSCTFTVTVIDNTPPTITCPANITTSSPTGRCDAVVNFPDPMALDNCSRPTVSCSPQSGSIFPAGITTVTCKATDSGGNMATCTFTVKVNDTQPPQITCPSNVTAVAAVTCPPSASAVVTFPVPVATDNCPGVTTMCTPASGSTFGAGTTTVNCKATDASGNMASCSFTVTVFNGCLQDDSNSGTVVLFNTTTGQYRFCCNGTAFTGTGTPMLRGCTFTLQHIAPDRRVQISVDFSVKKGTASLQSPPGTKRCTIIDRDITNNTCNCKMIVG